MANHHLICPYRICRLIGHAPEARLDGHYTDHRGRRRERWRTYCKRCGTSECYERGLLEYLAPSELRFVRYRFRAWIKNWWRQDCRDCGKPLIRCGRVVGDHGKCDDVPF